MHVPELQQVPAPRVSPAAEAHLPAPPTHLLFFSCSSPVLLLLFFSSLLFSPCVSVTFVYIPSNLILQWRPRHHVPKKEWLWLLLRMITKYGDAELLWFTQPRTKYSFAPYTRGSSVHCTIMERHNKCIAMHFVTSLPSFLKISAIFLINSMKVFHRHNKHSRSVTIAIRMQPVQHRPQSIQHQH